MLHISIIKWCTGYFTLTTVLQQYSGGLHRLTVWSNHILNPARRVRVQAITIQSTLNAINNFLLFKLKWLLMATYKDTAHCRATFICKNSYMLVLLLALLNIIRLNLIIITLFQQLCRDLSRGLPRRILAKRWLYHWAYSPLTIFRFFKATA